MAAGGGLAAASTPGANWTSALSSYIQPTDGGCFFALPGVRGPGDHLASSLLA